MAGEADTGAAAGRTLLFSALKPQICVPGAKADEAISFYKSAFGAEELKRSLHPKRKADQELPLILCCELKIGGSVFIVCDETGDCARGSGFTFCLETDDVAAAISSAVQAGATVEGEIAEGETNGLCGGGRTRKLKDPFGYIWAICSVESESGLAADGSSA